MYLSDFTYYFNTTGTEGGLFSLGFTFRPLEDNASADHAEMKRVTRENFERLRDVLDDMLLQGERIRCEREPVFTDSPGSSSGGYQYQGKVLGDKLSFKINPSARASVTFELGKFQANQIQIKATFELTHAWNVTAMQTVLALPGIRIGDEAQRSIDDLLKLTQSATDTDSQIRNLLEDDHADSGKTS